MSRLKDPTGRYIDLHLHSTASDGAYAPASVMEMAAARGLAAVALTDHDTVAGVQEAARAATELGLEFLTGIEFAADYPRGAMHLLGYGFEPSHGELMSLVREIVIARDERNRSILERLRSLGVCVRYEDLVSRHPGAVIGRPHIAHAIVRAGAAASFQEAFNRFLGRGASVHVDRWSPSAERIIDVIRSAGGAAVLAHPSQLKCQSRLELDTILHRLKSAGLAGIEAIHPDHRSDQTSDYIEMARRMGLATTGGSDFHAFPSDAGRIGFGRTRVPHVWLEGLRKHIAA